MNKFCICVIDPEDGEEMFVRHGIVPGEGPIATWDTREEAQSHVSFMRMGLEQGEDYESISILQYRRNTSKPEPVTHIVALSGGKDSTAMALWLAENEPRDYRYICTPTQDELPEMEAHWTKLGELLGSKIERITTISLVANNIRHGAIPNWRMRFCTRDLKIEPFKRFMLANRPAVAYVGLRADEEDRQGLDYGKAGGEVYGSVDGVTQRFPLRELGWGEADVWAYLDARGVTIPRRTDCARCFFQRLIEWYELWRDYPEKWAEIEAEEEFHGHTYRSEQRDSWPAALKDLRAEFEKGRVPKDTRVRTVMCRACSL